MTVNLNTMRKSIDNNELNSSRPSPFKTMYLMASSPLNNRGNLMKPPEFSVVMSILPKWISVYRGTKSNNQEDKKSGLVITNNTLLFKNENIKQCCNFLKDLSKTKVLRYLKVMILNFALRAFNFNFYKKNLTTHQNYLSFPRGNSFLKQTLFYSLYEVSIGFDGTVFSKNDVGGHVWMRRQKNFRGRDLPGMMPCI